MTTITSAMGMTVEQNIRPGYDVPTDMTRHIGVLHTGEVPPTVDGLLGMVNGFGADKYAPTFAVGPGRIIQTRPIGVMCGTLAHNPQIAETNGWAAIQIEVAGYSSESSWLPGDQTRSALAHLLAELSHRGVVPLERPFTGPWTLDNAGAHENTRRTSGLWGKKPGWWAHAEVPYQSPSWHWDPGNLRWDTILADAHELVAPAPTKARYYLVGRGPRNHVTVTAVAKSGGGRGTALYAASVGLGVRLIQLVNGVSEKDPGRVCYRRTLPRATPPKVGDPFD